MPGPCEVDGSCVQWEPPEGFLCDPCVDVDTDDGAERFGLAWSAAVQHVYRKVGLWPGDCFVERLRPCVDPCGCRPSDCRCGRYTALSLWRETCLPVVDVLAVNIAPNPCHPDGRVLTPAEGTVRLEWVGRDPRVVVQDPSGCCGWWPSQDLCRPDGADGTWSVDVRTGAAPPADVLAATGALANLIVRECAATGCGPAAGMRRVTTRGATFEADPDAMGSSMWLKVLADLFEEYDPSGRTVEQFCDPDSSVSFHRVFGPVPVDECDALGCGVWSGVAGG